MSVADIMSSVQALPMADKLQLYKLLDGELRRHHLQPLPEDFPPSKDQCPATREELESSRRQPGIYSTDEVLDFLRQL